jgi:hypothetical protein
MNKCLCNGDPCSCHCHEFQATGNTDSPETTGKAGESQQCPRCGCTPCDCGDESQATDKQRIMYLEAEVKELRHLWIQNEGWLVALKGQFERHTHKHDKPGGGGETRPPHVTE